MYIINYTDTNGHSVKIKKLREFEIVHLLDEIDKYNKNTHYKRFTFERNFRWPFFLDEEFDFWGMFDADTRECLSLIYITERPAGFAFVKELAAFKPGNNYGIKLMAAVLGKTRCKNAWFMSSPDSGEKLASHYRKIPGLTEIKFETSTFDKPVSFFGKTSSKKKFETLVSYLTKNFVVSKY